MITTISYRRVKNLGNYQSETIEAQYLLSENETPEEGMIKLRSFVLHELYPEDPNKVTEDDIDNISF
jgi:hypothetical protein